MSELAAALGCAQLERLPELLNRRAHVAASYHEALASLARDICLPAEPDTAQRSWFVYVIRLRDHFAAEARDQLINLLHDQDIGCAPYFPPIHLQPYYREQFGFQPGAFPICERLAARTLALPFFPELTDTQIGRVVDALVSALPDLPRDAS